MASSDHILKQCARKEQCVHPNAKDGWLPATPEFFRQLYQGKWLAGKCKACIKADKKVYQQANLPRYQEANRRRKAKIKANGSVRQQYSVRDVVGLVLAQINAKGKLCCWWCGKKVDERNFHVDHRIPVAKGGTNAPSNLCIACPDCNRSKHDKLPHEWAGRLL